MITDLLTPSTITTIIELVAIFLIVFHQGRQLANRVSLALQEPTKQMAASATTVTASANTVTDTLSELAGVLKYLADANIRLSNEKNIQDQKIKTLEDRVTAYTVSIDTLLKEQQKREDAAKVRDDALDALHQEVGHVKVALEGTQSDLEKTRQESQDNKAKLDAAIAELATTKDKLAAAENRIAELERLRDEERHIASKEKLMLETELKDERDKRIALEGKVKTLEGQVKDLQTQLDAQATDPHPPVTSGGHLTPPPSGTTLDEQSRATLDEQSRATLDEQSRATNKGLK